MKKEIILGLLISFISCEEGPDRSQAFVPESSGNFNHVTVVMPENDWNTALGKTVRSEMEQIYEGLPLD